MIGFSFGSMTLSRNRLSHHCIDSNTSGAVKAKILGLQFLFYIINS